MKDFIKLSEYKISEENSKFYDLLSKNCKTDFSPVKYLKINMTNFCNLRCKYCYADEGTYCKESQKFESYKIKDLMKFISFNPYLEGITFFGGEPLLNYSNINLICKLVSERIPDIKFFLQTNGTEQCIMKKFIRLLKNITLNVLSQWMD